MTNQKTTALGIITIIAAIAAAAKSYLTGSMPDIGVLASSIAAGWGLIAAKDAK